MSNMTFAYNEINGEHHPKCAGGMKKHFQHAPVGARFN
jgi:hypothetical protein